MRGANHEVECTPDPRTGQRQSPRTLGVGWGLPRFVWWLEGSGGMADYSASEMMAVAAARQVRDGQVVFVGIGLPFLAAILAKRTHAPLAVLLCESGVVDADPARLPLSVADPALVDGTAGIATMLDYFNLLFGGKVDVGEFWDPAK